jgi:hypothetical protein
MANRVAEPVQNAASGKNTTYQDGSISEACEHGKQEFAALKHRARFVRNRYVDMYSQLPPNQGEEAR